jgi:hypothetical protein
MKVIDSKAADGLLVAKAALAATMIRISVGPVVAASRDQAHPFAVASSRSR